MALELVDFILRKVLLNFSEMVPCAKEMIFVMNHAPGAGSGDQMLIISHQQANSQSNRDIL